MGLPRSLQAQLALRLATVFLLATVLGVGALLYEGMDAADTLGNAQLERRAAEIARYVAPGSDGSDGAPPHLEPLPPELDRAYHSPARTDLFAVRAGDGRVIAASGPEFAAAAFATHSSDLDAGATASAVKPRPFRLEEFGPAGQDYYGLVVREGSAVGPLTVAVARASDADALAHALLREFVLDVAWIIPLFAAATLAVGVWSIRRGLAPVRLASERAAAIAPDSADVRLPTGALPSELVPLAAAVNRALDRLEQGFAAQRRFTADAAHELRTPLAILTAGLEALEDGDGCRPEVARLRGDAARMNRLVEQLLRVARLDAAPTIDTGEAFDLRATAAACVEYLAPWAIDQGRALGFDGPEEPVPVRGDPEAVADALRNLVENAVAHAPTGTEVTVAVCPDGGVSVSDRGPGVAPEDRAHVFERFWRGRGERRSTGAGLGLAIVAEIARAHGGAVEVGDAPGGGAVFTLRLRCA